MLIDSKYIRKQINMPIKHVIKKNLFLKISIPLSPKKFTNALTKKNLNPLPINDIIKKLNRSILKMPLVIEIILKGKGVKAPRKTINEP